MKKRDEATVAAWVSLGVSLDDATSVIKRGSGAAAWLSEKLSGSREEKGEEQEGAWGFVVIWVYFSSLQVLWKYYFEN